jgi:hypothetical protein
MRCYFCREPNHCAQCAEPFPSGATKYLVDRVVGKYPQRRQFGFNPLVFGDVTICERCLRDHERGRFYDEVFTLDGRLYRFRANWRCLVICEGCGYAMRQSTSRLCGPRRTVCSDACRIARRSMRRKQRRAELKVSVTKDCSVCGEAFIPTRKDAVYCGAACRQKAYRLRQLKL